MRDFCNVCFQPNAFPFVVPDQLWKACVPTGLQKAELCVMCFAKFGDERLLPWEDFIEFNPISRVGVERHKQQALKLAETPFTEEEEN
jgi:hypothetical protein